ncbi:MAG TPA: retropepsin-like aspartic protease [Terracidiphilus sp.]|jgi:predicted aspartyl protease
MPGISLRNLALFFVAALFSLFAGVSAPAQDTLHSAPLEIMHDKPFVMVMVNGKGPFRFVIDTGTGGEAFVTPELAAQLVLPQSGQITLSDPSGEGGRKVPVVLLDSLQIAGVEFSGVKAAVHNLGNGDGSCQGLLGFALFRDYLLTLDYPNRRFILTSGDLQPDGEHSVLPFLMPDGIPVVSLAIGAARIDALLDSGGSGLSLPSKVASRLKFASEYASLSNAHSLSTRFTLMGATLATDVHLGSYTFKHPFVEINPAFPLANFGSGPMQAFALTFDQKNRLVRFHAPQTTLRLSATPAPMHLQNAPDRDAADLSLVPVG